MAHTRRAVLTCVLAAVVLAALASCAVASTSTRISGTYTDCVWQTTGTSNWSGYAPSDGERHPVLVYVHGTYADWNGAIEGDTFASYAAAAGFTAVKVIYNSWLTLNRAGIDGHAGCIFGDDRSSSALNAICASARADCGAGVVVVGHSQGGEIAARAANYSHRIRAAYVIGVNVPYSDIYPPPVGGRALPSDKLRIVDGRSDTGSSYAALKSLTQHDCGTNPACIDATGAGYYVVQNDEVADGIADHCYPWGGCFASAWDPGWLPPSTKAWGYGSALEWLAEQTG